MKRRVLTWLGAAALVLIACSALPQLALAETPAQVDAAAFKRAATQHARSSLKHHAVGDVRGPSADSAGRTRHTSVRAADKFKAVHKREARDAAGNGRRRSLTASCTAHADCASNEYCDTSSQCYDCTWCAILADSITGTCPTQCGSSVNSCSSHSQCASNEYCDTSSQCYDCVLCAVLADSITGSCPTQCGNSAPSFSLTSCSAHTDCESDEYCDNGNECWGCNWCSLLDDAIGGAGTCPSQCSTSSDVCLSHSTCGSDEYCDAWLTCDACSNCALFDDAFDGKCPSQCSTSSSLEVGVIVGILLGCVAGVAGIITLIAFLCKCCCFRPRQAFVMQQQQQYPVYAMQQQPAYAMQQPQVVVVPAGAK